GGDLELAIGVKDHQVTIAANSNGALARKQPKNFGRLRGDEIDKLIVVDASTVHASVVDQRQAVFDPWATVGDFREIVPAKSFLVGEAEGVVVCGYHRNTPGGPPPPQRLLVLRWPQRWGEDVFGAFKPWRVIP